MGNDALDMLLNYYIKPGRMCDLGKYLPLVKALPNDVSGLVRVLQGLVLHIFWAERYGVNLSDERKLEVNIRHIQPKLARLLEINTHPLIEARPFDQRLVGNCRDFALLLSAFLKAHGIPARPRCGFGTYFLPGHYEDHWMTEYWLSSDNRWVQVDAQLDDFQKQVLGITFDTQDMPPGQFVLAGEAWQLCRKGKANPDDFGLFEWHGWDFIRGNVMRDFLSLNKITVLPWDFWGATEIPVANLTAAQMEQLDAIVELSLQGNNSFSNLCAFYEQTPILRIPDDW